MLLLIKMQLLQTMRPEFNFWIEFVLQWGDLKLFRIMLETETLNLVQKYEHM